MSFTSQLNNTCDIYRATNAGNNVSPDYRKVLLHASLDCLIDEMSQARVIRKEGDKILADTIIYIDYIADLEESDIIKVDSVNYQIKWIRNPNKMNRHLEIYCLNSQEGTEPYDS